MTGNDREIRRIIHLSFSVGHGGGIKIPGRSRRPRAPICQRLSRTRVLPVHVLSFIPTRIQKPIYIYDVSRLDDTATGYAGLGTSRELAGGNRRGKGVGRGAPAMGTRGETEPTTGRVLNSENPPWPPVESRKPVRSVRRRRRRRR